MDNTVDSSVNNKPPFVAFALSGIAGTGKDTAAKYLEEKYGFRTFAFAEELKSNISKTYKLSREFLEDKNTPSIKYNATADSDAVLAALNLSPVEVAGELFITPRTLMIVEGTVKKITNPNYFCDALFNSIYDAQSKYCEEPLKVVVTDLRFINEMKFLKDHGFVTIRITRSPAFTTVYQNNSSENQLVNELFDYYVTNVTGDLDNMYSELDSIVTKIC